MATIRPRIGTLDVRVWAKLPGSAGLRPGFTSRHLRPPSPSPLPDFSHSFSLRSDGLGAKPVYFR